MKNFLLIVLGLFVLVAGAGVYFAHSLRVHEASSIGSKDVSIETPVGSLRIRAREGDAGLGIPLYPGATRTDEGGRATFTWSSGDSEKSLMAAGETFRTRDSPDDVVAWYRERLAGWVLVAERRGWIHFEVGKGSLKRIVSIGEKNGETHIAVASVGAPASN